MKNAKLILFNSKKNHRPPRDDIEDPFGPIPTIEVGGRASSHRKHHTGINNTITAIDSHRVRILMPSFILVLKIVPNNFSQTSNDKEVFLGRNKMLSPNCGYIFWFIGLRRVSSSCPVPAWIHKLSSFPSLHMATIRCDVPSCHIKSGSNVPLNTLY